MSYSSNIHLSKDEYYDLLVKKAQALRRVPTFEEVDADENMPKANSYAFYFKEFSKAIDQLKLDVRLKKVTGVELEEKPTAKALSVVSIHRASIERPKEDTANTETQPETSSMQADDSKDTQEQGELALQETQERGGNMKKNKDTDVDLLRSMIRVYHMHNVMPNVSNWSRYKNELKYGYQTYVKRLGFGAYEVLKNMALEASDLNSPTDEQLEEMIKKWRDVTPAPSEAANSEVVQEEPEYTDEMDSEEILEGTEYEEYPESFSTDARDVESEPEGPEEALSDDENGLNDDTGEVDDSVDSDSSDDTSEASEDDFEGESEESEDSEEPEGDGSFEESDSNEEEESDNSESEEDTVIFSQSLQGAYFEDKDESESKFVQDMQVGGFTLHYEYDKETSKEVLTIEENADETLFEVVQRLSGLRTITFTR